ncbi:16S rRNA (uracil(1498)-N(3))-methyltransferase [Lentisphaerota bacterium ZTH]|nr:16S rRNA (uracil(1498)-N(3))-methyltransferase [Lentisphaerota bacterium]WET06303.1 16S rRNA (uracil(1498)-N(3))-methyltransferase [Lentisphaerota bacterium ZTH]
MNLILLFEGDFVEADMVRLDQRRFEHITRILKCGLGDKVKVGRLDGNLGIGVITEISENELSMRVKLDKFPAPAAPITLICALPRPKTLKKVVNAAVSAGVKDIYFIESWKVDKSYWTSPLVKPDGLREHVLLALEQGCDTVMPNIQFKRRFKPFVEDELSGIMEDSLGLTAHPQSDHICPAHLEAPVTLCIGPEGGFTDYEVELLEKHGCRPVHLGVRPLRTEFAVAAFIGRLI